MKPRLRALALLAPAALGTLAGAACSKEGAAGDLRREKAREVRLERLETSLSEVSGSLSEMSGATIQLNDQLLALRKTVESRDEGMGGELASIRGSVSELARSTSELRGLIASLQKDLAAARTSSSSVTKRLDDLSAKLGAVDQRLWVLEARYNDHLRKFHGQ